MKIFETLASQLKPGCSVLLNTVALEDGRLAVSVLFQNGNVKDAAANQIVPFVVKGTPQELDESFAFVVKTPLEKASGLLSNMQDYEEALAEAAANSKKEADAKKAAAEAKKAETEAKKKAKAEADAKAAAEKAEFEKRNPGFDFGEDEESSEEPEEAQEQEASDDLPED